MTDIEIPLFQDRHFKDGRPGKRTKFYRFFEILPAAISIGAIILLIVLSLISPFVASIYVLLIVLAIFIRAIGIAFRTVQGRLTLKKFSKIDWQNLLNDLENPTESLKRYKNDDDPICKTLPNRDPRNQIPQTQFSRNADKFTTKNREIYIKHLDNLQRLINSRNREVKAINQPTEISDLVKIPQKTFFPKPSDIFNMVIIALYNESYDILKPTIDAILANHYDAKHLIVVIAYEQRGGAAARETVESAKKDFSRKFAAFFAVEHPADLPDEVIGKGVNITFAGKAIAEKISSGEIYLNDSGEIQLANHDIANSDTRETSRETSCKINNEIIRETFVTASPNSNSRDFLPKTFRRLREENVIITTLDCDNRPDLNYFAYLTYEWITTENRENCSFQPVALFTNNIWDAPAPMRVIATANSFFNIITTMRPHMLRNFAAHSQGLKVLKAMNFWSTRTIVEDGHQYWRSWFFLDGNYEVVPLRIAIGQDAVLNDTYLKTLKAQFVQLRRWAYGASDIAYVANQLRRARAENRQNLQRQNQFRENEIKSTRHKPDKIIQQNFANPNGIKSPTKPVGPPLLSTLARFARLLESHVTWACVAPIVAVGAWAPLYLNPVAAHQTIIANDLPLIVAQIQQIAIVGLLITVFASLTLLPPRPPRYRRARSLLMLLQWVLMPITTIIYTSAAGYTSQIRLATGHYLNKFDLTEKAVKK